MKKPLRMDSITHEDIDPNSVLGRAILAGDKATIRKIALGLKADRDQVRRLEAWAAAGFQSDTDLTADEERASLESQDEEETELDPERDL